MASMLDKRYLTFYLEGREDVSDSGVEAEFDLDGLAKKIAACENVSQGLATVTRDAAQKALAYLETSAERGHWVDDHHEQLDNTGLDPDDAYTAFSVGRVDELRYMMEEDVIGRMIEICNDEPATETVPS